MTSAISPPPGFMAACREARINQRLDPLAAEVVDVEPDLRGLGKGERDGRGGIEVDALSVLLDEPRAATDEFLFDVAHDEAILRLVADELRQLIDLADPPRLAQTPRLKVTAGNVTYFGPRLNEF